MKAPAQRAGSRQAQPQPKSQPQPGRESKELDGKSRFSVQKCGFLTGILFIVIRVLFLAIIGKIPLEIVRAWPPDLNLNTRHKDFRKLLELAVYSVAYLIGCCYICGKDFKNLQHRKDALWPKQLGGRSDLTTFLAGSRFFVAPSLRVSFTWVLAALLVCYVGHMTLIYGISTTYADNWDSDGLSTFGTFYRAVSQNQAFMWRGLGTDWCQNFMVPIHPCVEATESINYPRLQLIFSWLWVVSTMTFYTTLWCLCILYVLVFMATMNIANSIERDVCEAGGPREWDAAKRRLWEFGDDIHRTLHVFSWGWYINAGMLANVAYVYLSLHHSATGCTAFKDKMALVRCSMLVSSELLSGNVQAVMDLGQVLVPMALTLCMLAPAFALNRQMAKIEREAAKKRALLDGPSESERAALSDFEDFAARQQYRCKFYTGDPITIGSYLKFITLMDFVVPQFN